MREHGVMSCGPILDIAMGYYQCHLIQGRSAHELPEKADNAQLSESRPTNSLYTAKTKQHHWLTIPTPRLCEHPTVV
jgi:hypothetical protein